MAMPKKRMSRTRTGNRRSHHKLSGVGLRACPNCRELALPHRVCRNCGYYQGRLVRAPKARAQTR